MARTYHVSRRIAPAVALLVSLLLLATPAPGQVRKQPSSKLDELAFVAPELQIRSEIVALDSVTGQVSPEAAAQWNLFRAKAGPLWTASVDYGSGALELAEGSGVPWIPGSGRGNRLTQADVATHMSAKAKIDLRTLEAIALGFVPEVAALLRVNPTALVLNPGRSGPLGSDLWVVDFDLVSGDLPIEGSRVVFRLNHGNMVQFGAELVPARSQMNPRFVLSREAALNVVGLFIDGIDGRTDSFTDTGSRHLLPTAPAPGEPTLPFGRGYGVAPVWEFTFTRQGVQGTWRARVDAQSGKLLEFVDASLYASARVTGGVYPVTVADANETVMNMPFENVTPANLTTSSAGLYNWTSGTQTGALAGPYVVISDSCGAIADTSDASGNIAHGTSTGTDCTMPTGKTSTHAGRMQFYHVNRAKEKGRAYLPSNAWLQAQLTVNVNVNNTCNANWNGTALNFFRSGGGCANTGELAAVSLHEYGHGLDSNDGNGGSPDRGTGETYGDFTAALQTHVSCIGKGFLGSNCGGYGNACLNCTGVRDIDYRQRANSLPSTVANFIQPSCPTSATYKGPCGKEGHCESYVSSEALWDFAAVDQPGAPSAESWTVADRLWYLSRPTATAAFACTTGGTYTSNGCNTGSLWKVMRLVDDDDGDLTNGTPHSCYLYAAFNRHGIACTTDAGANTCYSGCPKTTPVPTLSAISSVNVVSLTWTASTGASGVVYDAYRTELGCSSGFTPIANDLSVTSYTDTAVSSGTTYSYQVTAHPPGNESCATAPSNCASTTPPASCTLGAATGVTATATAPNSVTVAWTAPAGATGYRILRSTVSGGPYAEVSSVGATTSWVDGSVAGGVTYYYVVRATNATCFQDSSEAFTTATGICGLPPSFGGVSSVASTWNATCQIALSWSAATTGCGALGGTISYSIYRSTSATFVPDATTRIATGLTGTAYTDAGGLVSGTMYYYIVRASDSANGVEDGNTVRMGAAPGTATFGSWTANAEGGASDPMIRNTPWALKTNYRYAGTSSYGVNSTNTTYPVSTCAGLETPPLVLSPTTSSVLTFWHLYSFEAGWDGGRVEIQDTATGTWNVLTSVGGYPSTVQNAGNQCGFPVGAPVYTGDSPGAWPTWQQVTVNVPASYQGRWVKIRWLFSSDAAASGAQTRPGWYVDDIQVTNATATTSACTTQADDVRFFTARATSGAVKLEWLNPTGTYNGTTIRRTAAPAACPTGPADGTLVVADTGAFGGLHRTFGDTIANGTTYCYAAYVRPTATGPYSSGRSVKARPFDTTGAVKWAYSTGASALTAPGLIPGALGSGAIYAVSNDRNIHSMNTTTTGGDWPSTPTSPADWTPLAMNGPSQGRPPVVPVTVGSASKVTFVGSQDGRVYCVNALTGALVWTSPVLAEVVQAAPVGIFSQAPYNGGAGYDFVFVGTRNAASPNKVWALKLADGTPAFSFDNGGGANGIGAISGDAWVDIQAKKLYFTSRARGGGSSGTVWRLGFTTTGFSFDWRTSVGDVDGSLVIANGRLYVGTNASQVYALDPATGAALWAAPYSCADGPVKGFVQPKFGGSRLYLSTNTKVWALSDGGASPSLAWSLNTIPGPSHSLYLSGSTLWVGSSNGSLYQINGVDLASPTGTTPLVLGDGSGTVGSPSWDFRNGMILVGTDAGVVYGLTAPY